MPRKRGALGCSLLGMSAVWAGQCAAQGGAPVPPLEGGVLFIVHPIFVHFAVALLVFGTVLDWAGAARRERSWQEAGRLSLFAGVAACGLAVLSGWVEQELPRPAGAFDPQIRRLLLYHEYGGYGLFGLFLFLAVVRARLSHRLPAPFVILSALGVAGLAVQGYLGGEMVYRYGAGVRAVQVLSHQGRDGGQKEAPAAPAEASHMSE